MKNKSIYIHTFKTSRLRRLVRHCLDLSTFISINKNRNVKFLRYSEDSKPTCRSLTIKKKCSISAQFDPSKRGWMISDRSLEVQVYRTCFIQYAKLAQKMNVEIGKINSNPLNENNKLNISISIFKCISSYIRLLLCS